MSRTRWTQLGAIGCLAGMLGWLALSEPPADMTQPAESGPAAAMSPLGASAAPCDLPLTWRLTRLDPEFGLDPPAAVEAVEAAAAAWGDALHEPAFSATPAGELELRIIYDDRQRRADLRKAREAELEALRRSADPSAGTTDAERLEAHRQYQEGVAALRADFPDVAFEAATYHEAVSTRDGASEVMDREIRIFRFDGVAELQRIVAHELGHALGLAHSTDHGSIMGEQYLGGVFEGGQLVTEMDAEALRSLCGRRRVSDPAPDNE